MFSLLHSSTTIVLILSKTCLGNHVKNIVITSFLDQNLYNFSIYCLGTHVKEIFITSFLDQDLYDFCKIHFGKPCKENFYYFMPRPEFCNFSQRTYLVNHVKRIFIIPFLDQNFNDFRKNCLGNNVKKLLLVQSSTKTLMISQRFVWETT